MTNEICVYYNKLLYDQKVILPLLSHVSRMNSTSSGLYFSNSFLLRFR
ncbi:hypothetical protein LEP1GSC074_1722, partial [Leptospira noguchii str. Hook]